MDENEMYDNDQMKTYDKAVSLTDSMVEYSRLLANNDFDIDEDQFQSIKTRIDIARGYLNKAEIKLNDFWVK